MDWWYLWLLGKVSFIITYIGDAEQMSIGNTLFHTHRITKQTLSQCLPVVGSFQTEEFSSKWHLFLVRPSLGPPRTLTTALATQSQSAGWASRLAQ